MQSDLKVPWGKVVATHQQETVMKQLQIVRRPKRRDVYVPDTRTPSGRPLPY